MQELVASSVIQHDVSNSNDSTYIDSSISDDHSSTVESADSMFEEFIYDLYDRHPEYRERLVKHQCPLIAEASRKAMYQVVDKQIARAKEFGLEFSHPAVSAQVVVEHTERAFAAVFNDL